MEHVGFTSERQRAFCKEPLTTLLEGNPVTGATVAALTIYDMAKAIEKEMVVAEVRLLEKTKEQI